MSSDNSPTEPLLELERVSVIRNHIRVLDRINLTLDQHRHTAIIGPNGAGKTSLLRLLKRDDYPSVEEDGSQGEVRILGRSDWEVADLWRQMGIVSSSLDHRFSVGRTGRMRVVEAVASGITAVELAEFAVPLTTQVIDRAREILELVDAAPLLDRPAETLSTGERRRVLIARALIHQPRILVLDEPTAGLDLAAREHFLQILRRLARQPELSILIVTHHLEELIPEVTHLVLLDQGRIAFDGPLEEGLTADRLSALYRMPLHVRRNGSGWSAFMERESLIESASWKTLARDEGAGE